MTRTLDELNVMFNATARDTGRDKRRATAARQAVRHQERLKARHRQVANGPALAGHRALDRMLDDRVARD